MPQFQPKARMSRRGSHPDIDEWGFPAADTYYTRDVADRDLNREMSDPGRRAFFMERVAEAQRREHYRVERQLAGTEYDGSFADGLRQYRKDRDEWREWVAREEGKSMYVDDTDVRNMTSEQYDAAFDANGRPLPHVFYHPNRSIRLNDQVDSDSVRELGGNR